MRKSVYVLFLLFIWCSSHISSIEEFKVKESQRILSVVPTIYYMGTKNGYLHIASHGKIYKFKKSVLPLSAEFPYTSSKDNWTVINHLVYDYSPFQNGL